MSPAIDIGATDSPPASVPVALPSRRRPARDASREEMPITGDLVDRYGRVHHDLRISVTDRCNLRCVYCMPETGVTFTDREQVLSFAEITRVARVAHQMGVTSLRLTGGEPLQRHRLTDLVRSLSAIGFEDIALTTNGTALARLAQPLADAGLTRVTVSCDSLDPETFARIRRRGVLSTVLQSMDAAEAAGLRPLKVNVVLMSGVNETEVRAFAQFARQTGRVVRFIEFMPLDAERRWQRDAVYSAERVVEEIDAIWPLEPIWDEHAPAERYRFRDGAGEIGVIASVTRPFCGTCDRLRLTADGAIRNCLFGHDEPSIRDVMRAGGSDEEMAILLRRAVWDKLPGHGINDTGFLRPKRSMFMIGG